MCCLYQQTILEVYHVLSQLSDNIRSTQWPLANGKFDQVSKWVKIQVKIQYQYNILQQWPPNSNYTRDKTFCTLWAKNGYIAELSRTKLLVGKMTTIIKK